MAEPDCDVKVHFDGSALDWTPDPARGSATVLYSLFSNDVAVSQKCTSILSNAEIERAERFKTADLKQRFFQRRTFRRCCAVKFTGSSRPLADLSFEEAGSGRSILLSAPSCWLSCSSINEGSLRVFFKRRCGCRHGSPNEAGGNRRNSPGPIFHKRSKNRSKSQEDARAETNVPKTLLCKRGRP